jgi:hypothetical protein
MIRTLTGLPRTGNKAGPISISLYETPQAPPAGVIFGTATMDCAHVFKE